MDKLNILVLHRLGDPELAPLFLRHHVFALKTYFPEHNYIYHDTEMPLPGNIRDTQFDAIILDVTLLCVRWAGEEIYQRIRNEYAFVKDSSAVKLAFPQDEYDCNQILDDWMCEWGVDVVFSVISSNWDVLYPKYHLAGEVRLGYTGYIDESLVRLPRIPFDDRAIDIGYRARKLPPYFGRIGEVKCSIGRTVADRAREVGLTTDIVLGESATLLGQAWLDFINNSKFTLGSNSGSSLLDPYGQIQRKVRDYLRENPSAQFDEVEEHCFKGLDSAHSFTAISPRVLEAGLLESCQILVEGEYSRVITPWEHYIPIRSDASDFEVVYEAMQDRLLVDRLRKNCRSALLDFDGLRASHNARKVIELIGALKTRKGVVSNFDVVAAVAKKYEEKMTTVLRGHWKHQAVKRKLSKIINKYPYAMRLAKSLRSVFGKRRLWK